ncbi:MAG: endolytic transglycosylase MltG [Rickettsiales bacterium]|nr:MAG: endolytic transglycosylase MltG [Rickettsiales bacterium]
MLKRKILKIKLLILISVIALSITSVNLLYGYLFLSNSLLDKKIVIIKPQSSIHEISNLLEKESVIKYRLIFELCGKIYSLFHPLKSGEYEFTAGITPYQVLVKLSSGTSIVRRLFIPEGTTTHEIITKINSDDRIFGRIISPIPEGYLMPSTYFYSYGDQKEKIIDQMRAEMSRALDMAMLKLSSDSTLKTRMDVLIMASIIEKEAANDLERAIIAGVFINRLKLGMKLQADPTVIYAITEGKYKLNRPLTRTDLQTDSPYNTYKAKGLPPTPICCPSLASIMAAVMPAKTDALYFVANGLGTHSFSSNLNDHNINVQKYRKSLQVESTK